MHSSCDSNTDWLLLTDYSLNLDVEGSLAISNLTDTSTTAVKRNSTTGTCFINILSHSDCVRLCTLALSVFQGRLFASLTRSSPEGLHLKRLGLGILHHLAILVDDQSHRLLGSALLLVFPPQTQTLCFLVLVCVQFEGTCTGLFGCLVSESRHPSALLNIHIPVDDEC